MTGTRRENRGRNAAAGNRQALLSAAREVFAEGGIDAPLSAVAKRAGVGQGSLYRHFPDRISLALAVFEDNVAELEAMAADSATTLDDLLALITRQTIESVAFVEIVTQTTEDPRLTAVVRRVQAALAGAPRGSALVGPAVDIGDIMLAVGMVAAYLAKMPPEIRNETAGRAWSLLRRGIG